jgi:transposase
MRPAIMPYDDAMRREAIERVTRGESCRAVSRALGIGHATVARWARMSRDARRRTTRHQTDNRED